MKQGPCGQEVNGRTDKVSVLSPGETIEVTWTETTDHRSYYRVAFDVDGDDAFPTFVGSGIGSEGVDPSALCPVDGQVILAYDMTDRAGGMHTLQVRLPDVECERCTLQVVQFMYDTRRPYYFQCADLALRRAPSPAGELDAGALDASPGALLDAAPAMTAPESPSAAPGCSARIAPDAPSSPPADEGDRPAIAEPPSSVAAGGGSPTPASTARRTDGGCAIAGTEPARVAPWLLLLGVAWIWRVRRLQLRAAPRRMASR